MVAVIGFLMIIAIVALLLKGKMSPIVVLGVVPAIAALILRFSPVEIMGFIADETHRSGLYETSEKVRKGEYSHGHEHYKENFIHTSGCTV